MRLSEKKTLNLFFQGAVYCSYTQTQWLQKVEPKYSNSKHCRNVQEGAGVWKSVKLWIHTWTLTRFSALSPAPPSAPSYNYRRIQTFYVTVFFFPPKNVQFQQKLQNRDLWRALLNSMEWIRPQLYCIEIYILIFVFTIDTVKH